MTLIHVHHWRSGHIVLFPTPRWAHLALVSVQSRARAISCTARTFTSKLCSSAVLHVRTIYVLAWLVSTHALQPRHDQPRVQLTAWLLASSFKPLRLAYHSHLPNVYRKPSSVDIFSHLP
jgi:hypothetical protein